MRQLTLAAIALLTGASSSLAQGHMGTSAGATVHARRTATLPEAVGRRQRGSAVFAAKPHEAEQELPEGIPEPRNVEGSQGAVRVTEAHVIGHSGPKVGAEVSAVVGGVTITMQ